MERNEESVLSAIKDLQDLEARRRKDEEAARALREAAEAEARERVRKQAESARAEQARRAADEAAGEAARRDAEASQRMERLRAELAAVQADRQRLQERILDPVAPSAIPVSSPYRRGAMALMGLVAVCSLGLALALALRPPLPAVAPLPARTPAPAVDAAPLPPIAAPAPATTVVAAPQPPAADAPARPRPGRPGVRTAPGAETTRPPAAPAIDPCENSPDPTCGLDEDGPRSGRPRARRPVRGQPEIPLDL